MRPGAPTRHPAVAFFGAALLALACDADNRSSVASTTVESVVEVSRDEASGESAVDSSSMEMSAPSSTVDDPFADFGLEPLIDAQATIHPADAGAGIVVVDTLPAGDSVQVRLESRVDSLVLTATGPSGAVLGRKWVERGTEPARAVFP